MNMPLPFHPVRAILLPALQAASASLKSTSAHLCKGAADTAGGRHDHAADVHVLASECPGCPGLAARLAAWPHAEHVTHHAACLPNAPRVSFESPLNSEKRSQSCPLKDSTYNSSNVKFAFVKMQISLAIFMASIAMSFAESLVCLASARAAASAYGPPEPMAQIPSSGSITSPLPETRNVDFGSATTRSASRWRSAR